MSSDSDDDRETTRVTRKGQVTIPKKYREALDLEEGDEITWERGEDGLWVRKATRSAGRGMLVDDSASEDTREAMAQELEAEIREKRRTEWTPE